MAIMRRIGKSIGLLGMFLMLLTATCYAIPVSVTFDGVDTSKAAVRSSAWAGFYSLSENNEQILGMCDDYNTDVKTSGAWNAELYSYTDIVNGVGRWGTPVADYNVIGYLFMQSFDDNNSYIADRNLIADINQAIWKVHDQSLILTGQAQNLYDQAVQMIAYTGWYGYMNILTPALLNGSPVSQEFLVRGSGPAPVPEPATMLLLGAGLIGLAGFGRRRIRK